MAAFIDKFMISPVLVGRARQMESLEALLQLAQQGTGQVVLLTGEAGVGKSRLIAEVRRLAAHFTVLEGHCFERDLLFPYAPLIDALRTFLTVEDIQKAATVAEMVGPLAVELVKLLPELTLVIPNLQPTPSLDPQAEKRRLWEALLQFLLNLVRTRQGAPLLLILEDLHWGDEASLDFIHLLARRSAAYPICVLATYRSEEVSPHLRQWLTALDRERLVRQVVLPTLDRPDVHTMLQAIFEQKRPVKAEFLETVYTLTEGNPFFIEEVLKVLIATGDIFYADGAWDRKPLQELRIPPSIQEAVQRRTIQLSAAARQLLTLAAVAGRRFDFAVLQQVTALAEDDLLALIKELVQAQLVVEETPDQFAFRHALTRQAVYAGLLGRERQAHHLQIGRALEARFADALDSQVADLAYHFYEANVWDKALDYAQRAGANARALYAPRAAVQQFTRALAAAQHCAQASSSIHLYRIRGLAYETLGEFEQARRDLETALALAQTAGDHPGEWQGLLDLGQLWAARNYEAAGTYVQHALTLARGLNDVVALARSLNRVGNWHLNSERAQEALRYHQEALTLFQGLADRRGVAQTFDLLGMVSLLGGDPIHSALYLQQAITLYQALDDRQGLTASLTTLSVCGVSYSTEVMVPAALSNAECRHYNQQAQQIAQAIGWRAGEAAALIFAGVSLGAQGQYGEALAQVQRGLAIAQEIEHRQWICLAHRVLGTLYLDLLALPAAHQHLEQSLTLANELGSLYHARNAAGQLILLFLHESDLSQVEALLNRMFHGALPMEMSAQRLIWRGHAEFCLAQGNARQALQITNRLIDLAASVASSAPFTIPMLTQLRGEALAAHQEWSAAEAAFQATLATAASTPRLLWRIHRALGQLYQSQRRPAEATHAFATSQAVIEAIAATVPDRDLRENFLRQALALLPQPPTAPLRVAKQSDNGLTRRERDVVALIAQGKPNRAIAGALVLSERTVESYVSNILNKLNLRTRVQIAAWAVEKGLTKHEA